MPCRLMVTWSTARLGGQLFICVVGRRPTGTAVRSRSDQAKATRRRRAGTGAAGSRFKSALGSDRIRSSPDVSGFLALQGTGRMSGIGAIRSISGGHR